MKMPDRIYMDNSINFPLGARILCVFFLFLSALIVIEAVMIDKWKYEPWELLFIYAAFCFGGWCFGYIDRGLTEDKKDKGQLRAAAGAAESAPAER